MSPAFKRVLAAKARGRRALAALPVERKLELLERLRDRGEAMAAVRAKARADRVAGLLAAGNEGRAAPPPATAVPPPLNLS